MGKIRKGKKKIPIIVLSILLIACIAGGIFYAVISYKMSKMSSMTFDEMLYYTTKNNEHAVITVGIIRNGQMSYTVYGENGTTLSPEEHAYEIGSITKTFTTSLLCKAIGEGKVSFNDSIDKYLNLPKKEYYPTIERLVTHTSGYKSYYFEHPMISNFFHRRNDFYGITDDLLLERLGRISLKDKVYHFKYSNFGIATIGVVLEQIYDEDYSALMNAYISKDLGLANTKLSDGTGDLGKYWEWAYSDVYMAAGAIVSDISDMLQYAQMQMQEELNGLSAAHKSLAEVSATTESYEMVGIRIDSVGAGWIIDQKNNIIWHNGGTGNYNSYIGFDKEKQIAVVVLSNLSPNYRIPATVMGVKLLKDLREL